MFLENPRLFNTIKVLYTEINISDRYLLLFLTVEMIIKRNFYFSNLSLFLRSIESWKLLRRRRRKKKITNIAPVVWSLIKYKKFRRRHEKKRMPWNIHYFGKMWLKVKALFRQRLQFDFSKQKGKSSTITINLTKKIITRRIHHLLQNLRCCFFCLVMIDWCFYCIKY